MLPQVLMALMTFYPQFDAWAMSKSFNHIIIGWLDIYSNEQLKVVSNEVATEYIF